MIVPGSASPLMWGQGDPLDELGVIMNSVRFNPPDAPRFTRSLASTANTTKFTLFFSGKRSDFGTNCYFIFSDGSVQRFGVYFDANDKFHVDANGAVYRQTTRVFRDPNAHLNGMIAIDTSLAPSNNCIRIYFDDKEETAFDTLVNPSTGQAMSQWNNSSQIQYIGTDPNTGDYFGGMLSRVGQVAGQQLTPAATGSIHPKTGQWRPKTDAAIKALVDAGGTHSFFLNFSDGSVADATHLGKDFSAQGNNWTPVNISVAAGAGCDWMTDTPTNNFCTLNRLLPINILTGGYYPILPTDGALKITGSSAPPANFQNGSQLIKFKTYYEIQVGAVGAGIFTIGVQNVSTGAVYQYQQDGQKNLAGTASAYGATFTVNDRVAVAVDPVARSLEFFKQTGGSGAFVSQGVIATAFPAGDYVPFFYASNGTILTVNFGQQGFSNSSLPSGALALNTKNLARPSIPKASKAFAAVTDTGANILSTLAAAESWANYIRIVKRRDAAEGWRWMFSDDPTNYLDTSSTAAKAAIPSFSGTSYAGFSIKVSAANGVATGRLTHTNGVADTVTDNLGGTRKAIILKNEATGTWYLYHPDLTAGKLLYLEQSTAETTDATLGTVLSNSFVVAAALASGTYRWIAFADLDGFLKLFSYTANNSTDGTYSPQGLTAAFSFLKRSSIGGNGKVYDLARSPYNVVSLGLAFDSTAGDVSVAALDDVSGGLKLRISGQDPNATGTEIGISFGQPFRYANAR